MTYRPPNSPLRYPGGKRKLARVLHQLCELDGTKVKTFIEPFVGGAAASISFLENSQAQVVIGDLDSLVNAFWKVVFSKKAIVLSECIRTSKPTLKTWHEWRLFQPQSTLEMAFKCLYLNRTSFSGILNSTAGPIGGMSQSGKYVIGCRFNSEALASRILELSAYRERVRVLDPCDWRETVSYVRRNWSSSAREGVFWYLDPPFFQKAERLYTHSFDSLAHARLRRQIDLLPGRFALSYDDVPAARKLYNSHPGFLRVNLSYNARVDRSERLVASEILVSNIIAELRGNGRLPSFEDEIVHPVSGSASHLTLNVTGHASSAYIGANN